jgi:hypothetical protein
MKLKTVHQELVDEYRQHDEAPEILEIESLSSHCNFSRLRPSRQKRSAAG